MRQIHEIRRATKQPQIYRARCVEIRPFIGRKIKTDIESDVRFALRIRPYGKIFPAAI